MKPNCLLLTWNYPFLPAEEPFILPELKTLPERFNVRLLACTDRGVPKNAPAACPVPYADAPRIDGPVTWLYALADGNLRRDLRAAAQSSPRGMLRETAGYLVWSYYHAHAFARGLMRECARTGFVPDAGYSFWGKESAYALLLLKRSFPSMKAVSRFHGCDLYLSRGIGNVLPFRSAFGQDLDRLFFISEHGRGYWLDHFPCEGPDRSAVRLLGCAPPEVGPAVSGPGPLRLFSCSSAIPLKRIGLLIRALSLIPDPVPVFWTHVGGGPELDALRSEADAQLSAKPNVRYSFTGPLPNERIRPLYVREGAGLFINVSESEGLPVSMMEAMSVGIPLMGTDVGGVSELIGPDTGILLPADPSPKEIADAIAGFALLAPEERSRLSENARALWSDRLNADENAVRFARELEDLCASVANAPRS